jgi:hypothetical protein
VGDGCQPAHDPRIDQAPTDEVKALRAQVERLQRENGSLARMSALTAEKLRERTGRLNEAIARLSVIVDAFDGDCRLDHHGFCQEHLVTKPCEILEARRFLALASD